MLGPSAVMLGPDEQFTVINLSGDKPKRPNVIKSLFLNLGPDFMTDIVTVETSDHARLKLQLSYNWHFDVSTPSLNTLLPPRVSAQMLLLLFKSFLVCLFFFAFVLIRDCAGSCLRSLTTLTRPSQSCLRSEILSATPARLSVRLLLY